MIKTHKIYILFRLHLGTQNGTVKKRESYIGQMCRIGQLGKWGLNPGSALKQANCFSGPQLHCL